MVRRLGPEHVFVFEETGKFWTSTLEAVRFAYEIIGDDVCETCPRHARKPEQERRLVLFDLKSGTTRRYLRRKLVTRHCASAPVGVMRWYWAG